MSIAERESGARAPEPPARAPRGAVARIVTRVASMLGSGDSMLARVARTLARAAPALALVATVLLALAAWLAWPRPRAAGVRARPALRALLVDLSASTTRTRPEHARWLRAALLASAREASELGEELLVVRYAADVEPEYGPAAPEDFEERLLGRGGRPWSAAPGAGGDLASRLCSALELARAELLAPGRRDGRLELFADGGATDGDARAALERLARAGVRVHQHVLPAPRLADVALRAIDAPRVLEEGAPLAVVLEIEARVASVEGDAPSGAPIELTLEWSRAGERAGEVRRVALPVAASAGAPLVWRERFDPGVLAPGVWRLDARARWIGAAATDGGASAGDPLPENDAARAELRVEGSIAVGLATSDALAADLAAWRAPGALGAGVDVLAFAPDALAPALGALDALVTVDLGPARLPGAALASWVRAGGAWIALDGWSALADGGVVADRAASDAAPLLPLVADELGGERDVVLVIDGSGSMAGEPFERVRDAVRDLLRAASPRDRVELRFFTSSLGAVELEAPRGGSPGARESAALALLARRTPSGGTDVLAALEELARLRAASGTRALVLLLTDGRTADADRERARAARSALASAGSALRVVAIGADADEELLGALLAPGEELVRARDLRELGALLAREVAAERVASGDLRCALAPPPPDEPALAAELREAWRAPLATPRALARHERARLAPLAHALWLEEGGAPLLALARAGRGWTAACATSPAEDWATFLAREPALLAPLVRALARESREALDARPTLALDAERVRLEGVPTDWPARLEARITALGPRGERAAGATALALPPIAPGDDPRRHRVGLLPREAAALPRGTPLLVELSAPDWREVLAAHAPLPAELAAAPAPALAADLPAPEPARAAALGPHRAAAPLLGAALGLLFLSGLGSAAAGQAARGSGRE